MADFYGQLASFGLDEDAISTANAYIYHSDIIPLSYVGLLDLQDVINQVIEKDDSSDIPMNPLGGSIQKMIGGHKFMYWIYALSRD